MSQEKEITELREINKKETDGSMSWPEIQKIIAQRHIADKSLKIVEALQKEIEERKAFTAGMSAACDFLRNKELQLKEENAQLKERLRKYEPYPEGSANQAKTSFLEQLSKT